MLLEKINKLET